MTEKTSDFPQVIERLAATFCTAWVLGTTVDSEFETTLFTFCLEFHHIPVFDANKIGMILLLPLRRQKIVGTHSWQVVIINRPVAAPDLSSPMSILISREISLYLSIVSENLSELVECQVVNTQYSANSCVGEESVWIRGLPQSREISTRWLPSHYIGDAAAESTSEYSRSRLVPSALRRLYWAIFERYVRTVRFVRGSSTSSV